MRTRRDQTRPGGRTAEADPVHAGSDPRWHGRPVLAGLLRAALLAVPLLASSLTVAIVGRAMPVGAARTWWGLGALLLLAVLVAVVVERGARKLLPITVLLKMTLLFPDRAPSRLKIARQAMKGSRNTERLGAGADAGTVSEAVLAMLADLGRHDKRTRGHSERVRVFCDMLAEQRGLDADARDRLRWSAMLHDLGKMQVPVSVLNKPAKLDDDEFDVIKRHPEAGAQLAAPLLPWLGEWGRGIAEHHEKYDGGGYPAGLAGAEISEAGRLIAVVDAFETMTAARPYKTAMGTKTARAELARCAGTHFDPVYVRAFLAISLPRLLWAMGPVSFLLQVPFLTKIAEAGTRVGTASGQAAVGVASTAAAVTAGVAVAGTAIAGGLPGQLDAPLQASTAAVAADSARSSAAPVSPRAELTGPPVRQVDPSPQNGVPRGPTALTAYTPPAEVPTVLGPPAVLTPALDPGTFDAVPASLPGSSFPIDDSSPAPIATQPPLPAVSAPASPLPAPVVLGPEVPVVPVPVVPVPVVLGPEVPVVPVPVVLGPEVPVVPVPVVLGPEVPVVPVPVVLGPVVPVVPVPASPAPASPAPTSPAPASPAPQVPSPSPQAPSPSAAPSSPPAASPTPPPPGASPVPSPTPVAGGKPLDTTITQFPDSVSTSTTATFSMSSAPGVTFECRLDRDKNGWFACTSPITFENLQPGAQRFRVRAVDSDGEFGKVEFYDWRIT